MIIFHYNAGGIYVGRISLVIADSDPYYVESIVNFLISNYHRRFQVNSFTKTDCLAAFLSESKRKVDILLISPELYSDSLDSHKINTPILLCDGKEVRHIKGYKTVNKYQHGDRIVSSIINIFSENTDSNLCTVNNTRKTKIIAVYSPAGGVGKTCIAVCSSILCAQKGLATLYLNLENSQSTTFFFKGSSALNLSNILYNLKDTDGNFNLKMEGIKCVDPKYNVHYFLPPDNSLELDEVHPDELKFLMQQLKSAGLYDVVFVDMTNNFDKRNIALLEACDDIFFVTTADEISKTKVKSMINQLNMLPDNSDSAIWNKAIVILNKWANNMSLKEEDIVINGKSISIKLSECEHLKNLKGPEQLIDINNGFSVLINVLISKYVDESRCMTNK